MIWRNPERGALRRQLVGVPRHLKDRLTICLAHFDNPPIVSHSFRMLIQRAIDSGQLQIDGDFMGICWYQCTFIAFDRLLDPRIRTGI